MEKTDPENILPDTKLFVGRKQKEPSISTVGVTVSSVEYTFNYWTDLIGEDKCIVVDLRSKVDRNLSVNSTFLKDLWHSLCSELQNYNLYMFLGSSDINNLDLYSLEIDRCIFNRLNLTKMKIKKIVFNDSYFLDRLNIVSFESDDFNFQSCHFFNQLQITFGTCSNLDLYRCSFESAVDFASLTINKMSVARSNFKSLSLSKSKFDLLSMKESMEIQQQLSFEDSELKKFEIGACSPVNINFKRCYLNERVNLSQVVNCNFDFSNAVINGEVCFQNNNLSDSRFDNVDLSRNFRFNNVRWHPDGEIRGKLKLEEDARDATEPEEKKRKLNQVLKHYHELVIYYDGTRDIEQSERFFISEMELRKELSESWWEKRAYELYGIYSVYGTSWVRTLFMLFVTLMFVVPLVFFVHDIVFTNKTDLTGIFRYVEDSLRLLMLQKGVYDGVIGTKFYLQAISQLALLGQTALLFLAIRRHFRRSPSASQ